MYKLNDGTPVSKAQIQDAFAKKKALLIYYQDGKMDRPLIGLSIDGNPIRDARDWSDRPTLTVFDIGQWSEKPTTLAQCLQAATRR